MNGIPKRAGSPCRGGKEQMKKWAAAVFCVAVSGFAAACGKTLPEDVAKKCGEGMLGQKCTVLYARPQGELVFVGIHPIQPAILVDANYTLEDERRDAEKARQDDMEIVLQKSGNSWEATHWRWLNR